MLNVINTKSIDTYLRNFCGFDERLETFLVAALFNIIKKSEECMEVLTELPEDAPDWLKAKWDKQPVWHYFDDKNDGRLAGHVYQVVLWLEAAIEFDLEWIYNLDAQGRPKRLLQAATIDHLYNLAEKDANVIAKLKTQKAKHRLVYEDLKADFDTVMTFEDGFSIVRLKTKKAIDLEGDFLSHCMGDGNYDYCLGGNVTMFYSLRDCQGMPCVSLQIDNDVKQLVQAKGRKNAFPKGKFIPYITTFCRELYIDATHAFSFEAGYELIK